MTVDRWTQLKQQSISTCNISSSQTLTQSQPFIDDVIKSFWPFYSDGPFCISRFVNWSSLHFPPEHSLSFSLSVSFSLIAWFGDASRFICRSSCHGKQSISLTSFVKFVFWGLTFTALGFTLIQAHFHVSINPYLFCILFYSEMCSLVDLLWVFLLFLDLLSDW